MKPATPVVVSAAVIERDERFLVTRRPEGTHLAGHWEFPGGKCEGAETPEGCLRRELREELDIEAAVGEEIYRTSCRYDAAPGGPFVELRFFRCTFAGSARPLLGQQMRWVSRHEMLALTFPPADAEFIALLTRA